MPYLRYSARAQHDLQRLFDFLKEKDAQVALKAISEIRASLTLLLRMPETGRPVEDGLREYIIDFGSSGYIALYEFDSILDEIVVFAVKHQLKDDYK